TRPYRGATVHRESGPGTREGHPGPPRSGGPREWPHPSPPGRGGWAGNGGAENACVPPRIISGSTVMGKIIAEAHIEESTTKFRVNSFPVHPLLTVSFVPVDQVLLMHPVTTRWLRSGHDPSEGRACGHRPPPVGTGPRKQGRCRPPPRTAPRDTPPRSGRRG